MDIFHVFNFFLLFSADESEESQYDVDESDLSFSENEETNGPDDDINTVKSILSSSIAHTLKRLNVDSQISTAVKDISDRLSAAESN